MEEQCFDWSEKEGMWQLELVSELVGEGIRRYGLLFSHPSLRYRIVSGDGFVLGFEPVWYDYRSEKLLDGYSAPPRLFAEQSECLFAEGHHDLIRYFSSRYRVFEYPGFYDPRILRTPMWYVARGKAYKNTASADTLFAHFFETLRLEQDICYDTRRKKPEPFVLAELDGRVLCRG